MRPRALDFETVGVSQSAPRLLPFPPPWCQEPPAAVTSGASVPLGRAEARVLANKRNVTPACPPSISPPTLPIYDVFNTQPPQRPLNP